MGKISEYCEPTEKEIEDMLERMFPFESNAGFPVDAVLDSSPYGSANGIRGPITRRDAARACALAIKLINQHWVDKANQIEAAAIFFSKGD